MQYMLLICGYEGDEVAPEDQTGYTIEDWVAEMDGRGVRLVGSELGPARDTTSVRVRDGELSITDGPFAEAKEQMAGFDLIECADLDEAIEVASKHPAARTGSVQIRPLVER